MTIFYIPSVLSCIMNYKSSLFSATNLEYLVIRTFYCNFYNCWLIVGTRLDLKATSRAWKNPNKRKGNKCNLPSGRSRRCTVTVALSCLGLVHCQLISLEKNDISSSWLGQDIIQYYYLLFCPNHRMVVQPNFVSVLLISQPWCSTLALLVLSDSQQAFFVLLLAFLWPVTLRQSTTLK